jgi:hypothetical protein
MYDEEKSPHQNSRRLPNLGTPHDIATFYKPKVLVKCVSKILAFLRASLSSPRRAPRLSQLRDIASDKWVTTSQSSHIALSKPHSWLELSSPASYHDIDLEALVPSTTRTSNTFLRLLSALH